MLIWPQMPVGIDWFAVGHSTAAILQAAGLPATGADSGQDSEGPVGLAALAGIMCAPNPPAGLICSAWVGREYSAHRRSATRVGGRLSGIVTTLPRGRNLPRGAAETPLAPACGILGAQRASAGILAQAAAETMVASQAGCAAARFARPSVCNRQQHWLSDIIVCNGADDSAVGLEP